MIHDFDIAPYEQTASIFPAAGRTPFYIVAPRYKPDSAGIKVLHLLCHHLNALGVPAYLVIRTRLFNQTVVNPEWNTPLLTQQVADHYEQAGITPVVVYPGTVSGNPLHASVVMRYALHYPGVLGGDKNYAAEEMLYGYSHAIADFMGVPEQTLFMPTSNPNIFYPPNPETPRHGTCFWAAKYRQFSGQTPELAETDSVEITRGKDALTPDGIADLLRRSQLFYTYEDTALVAEALLCGCPVVYLPNEYMREPIGIEELGWDGIAWGDSPEEIARAKATIDKGRDNYIARMKAYWPQLQQMVNDCSARAQATAQTSPLQFESQWWVSFHHPTLAYPRNRRKKRLGGARHSG